MTAVFLTAISVISSKISGGFSGNEEVRKSYYRFFDDIHKLGTKVDLR